MAILFGFAVNLYLHSYGRHKSLEQKLDTLTCRLAIMDQQKKELERKTRILTRIRRFVEKAQQVGLEKSKWAFYDVNIEEPVSYTQLDQILGQCVNTESFYFKPAYFHAALLSEKDKQKISHDSSTDSADSHSTGRSDLMLSLKGTFIIKNK